jgi:xanthine dehydrogenase accessory factor
MQNIYLKAEEARRGKKRAALCLVVGTNGSTPRKTGAKMIVYDDGAIIGTIGGGSLEKDVISKALEIISLNKPSKFTFNLGKDLEMHCGGSVEVYIEPINPIYKLFIFGAGHVGRAVAMFANELDFAVTLFDPRNNIFHDDAFLSYSCIGKDYFEAIDEALFDENTYVVIVTPEHVSDEQILARVARKPHAYLGMIGSRQKVELLKSRFIKENILSAEELEKIDMPIGIKFRAETPGEIAISILAKLIDVRNKRDSIST